MLYGDVAREALTCRLPLSLYIKKTQGGDCESQARQIKLIGR
jgi:hypothetical protein